ncbi:MAG: glycosyltransferase family 4 protein [Planctomycetota bacterium]|nr:glycosyltransferase family 4 protein [Planctomycetota bacterium]
MRIAYVSLYRGVPVYGGKGCSLHVQEVLRVFLSRGDDVSLFAVNVGGRTPEGLEAVQLHEIPMAPAEHTTERERCLREANERAQSMLANAGPFDLAYERHALWSSAAAEYGSAYGVPSIIEVNAPLVDEQLAHRELNDRIAAEAATRRCFAVARVVACVSAEVGRYAQRHGASQEKIMIVPNGVRTDCFTPSDPDMRHKQAYRIGFVGSLRPWHAVGDLIEAFSLIKTRESDRPAELVIVGDGPIRDSLEQRVSRLPCNIQSAIHFTGHIAADQIPSRLRRFHVAVAPYAADEEFYFSPLKLYEYLATGLPVVAACTGQLSAIIENGRNGMHYVPGDCVSLAAVLERVRDDRPLAIALGVAARNDAVTHHRWEQRVQQMLNAAIPRNIVPLALTRAT